MRNNKQIGHILFNKIFLGYVLLATIFTSYHIYAQYSLAKNTVLKDMVTIEKAFYSGIASSVWHLDEKQINSNAQAIESIQGIVGVSIISAHNEVLSQKGTLDTKEEKYTNYYYGKNNKLEYDNSLIKHSFDVIQDEFSEGETLGSVNIYTSENAIYEIIKDSLVFILLYSIIVIVVLWALFHHFANKLLTNPLHQIIQATKELNIKEYKEISLNNNNKNKSELDVLVDTFNDMSKRITESFNKQRLLTITLNKQKKDLIEANKYQTDFLANMSHELKTPLNSINIISSVMSKNTHNELNEKQVKNLDIINKSGKDLLSLINDILDVSKIEAGEIPIYFEKLNILSLAEDIYHTLKPIAHNKATSLEKSFDIKDGMVTSDAKRIKQIINNLLSNAIKFTNKGKVNFNISENSDNIIVYVIDSGIGIEKDKREHIFDRFKQVDGSTTRKYGGTGLGLAISKELAGLLGGDLTVDSELNKGSVFKFSFPKNAEVNSIPDNTREVNKNLLVEPLNEVQEEVPLCESNKKNKAEKIKVSLFNNNPVEFFSLIIVLKKEEKLELLQLNNFHQVIDKSKSKEKNILILDIDSKDIDIKSLKQKDENSLIIGISSTLEKSDNIDMLFNKPIDIELILSAIYDKENQNEQV